MSARLKTLLASIIGALAALGTLAASIAAFLPAGSSHQLWALKIAMALGGLSALLGNAGSIFAGQRGLDAAAHVEAVTAGTQTVRAADKGDAPAAPPVVFPPV